MVVSISSLVSKRELSPEEFESRKDYQTYLKIRREVTVVKLREDKVLKIPTSREGIPLQYLAIKFRSGDDNTYACFADAEGFLALVTSDL